jgi:hypothetical protein
MVQTRRAYREWVENRGPNYSSQDNEEEENEPCQDCQQEEPDHGYEPDVADAPNHVNYNNNDHCKRHRKIDGHAKTEEVVSYRRRKPL